VNLGTLHVRFNPADLGRQRFVAGGELLDSHRVEVLLPKFDQRIAGFAGKKIVEIHGPNR
jgi:hypothetical protein